MDDKKKKQFVAPEAEIIDFSEEDIITMSSGNDMLRNWWEDPEGDGENF